MMLVKCSFVSDISYFISRPSPGDSEESGSQYVQAFAKFLKTEFTNKSVQDIFAIVDANIKVRYAKAKQNSIENFMNVIVLFIVCS